MSKRFLTIDLIPGFKENKNTTRIIILVTVVILVLTTLFRFVYMPLRDIENSIKSEEIIYTHLSTQSDYLWTIRNGQTVNDEDVMIDNTLRYIDSTQRNLLNRLLNLTTIQIDGLQPVDYQYDHSNNTLFIEVHTESDEALLKYIERLWDVYWIETVTYSTAGPGTVEINIEFTVGEVVNDEE